LCLRTGPFYLLAQWIQAFAGMTGIDSQTKQQPFVLSSVEGRALVMFICAVDSGFRPNNGGRYGSSQPTTGSG